MARQPSYRPLEPTEFFADGRASRPLVEGTVPRGRPLDESALLTYRRSPAHGDAARAVALVGNPSMNAFAARCRSPWGRASPITSMSVPSPSTRRPSNAAGNASTFTAPSVTTPWAPATARSSSAAICRRPTITRDYSRGFERRGVKSAAARRADRLLLRGRLARLRRDARLRQPDSAGRSLEDHRLCPRLAAEPVDAAQGSCRESERDKVRRELQPGEERT